MALPTNIETVNYIIYIEKLNNLSKLQVIVSNNINHNNNHNLSNIHIQLVGKSTLIIQHYNLPQHIRIPLPVDIKTDTFTEYNTNDYKLIQCHYTIDRTSNEDNDFPVAIEYNIQYISNIYCKQCGTQFLHNNTITHILSQPSEYWSELVDLWYCHTTGPPADIIGASDIQNTTSSNTNNNNHNKQPVIHNQTVQAVQNKILLSNTQILCHNDNVIHNNVKYSKNDVITNVIDNDAKLEQYWTYLYCNNCDSLIGEIELYNNKQVNDYITTNQVRLYKYALYSPLHLLIDANTNTIQQLNINNTTISTVPNIFRYYSITRCIIEQLLAAASAHIVYKFIIYDHMHIKMLYLGIISWDSTRKIIHVNNTQTISTDNQLMLPVIKCMYTDNQQSINKHKDDCEPIVVHVTEYNALLDELNNSNNTLPYHMSTINNMNLAYLTRLTRKDDTVN